nr:MAG TPA: hypothetical protein [Caudoviricetes sp.]DAV07111.1 MAG TPA: hypothetical protein [Caudoviricetes sp.]
MQMFSMDNLRIICVVLYAMTYVWWDMFPPV